MSISIRKPKILSKGANIKYFDINTIYALNDGRLAVGDSNNVYIFNMKTYHLDLSIELKDTHFILQLKDNSLFLYRYDWSSEGPSEDIYYYNNIIELKDKTYIDKKNVLPKDSKYNILREYSSEILFGGISYLKNEHSYCCTNASGPKRIQKLVKTNGQYQIALTRSFDFIDFILLKNNSMSVLREKYLEFYDIHKFIMINKAKVNKGINLTLFNDKYLLLGTDKNVIIFDYIKNTSTKSIACIYPLRKIFVNKNIVIIGETTRYNLSKKKADNQINEYEIDDIGNYKQKYMYKKPHNNELLDITQLTDGRIISCSGAKINIWK